MSKRGANQGYQLNKDGIVSVFPRDCDGGTYTEIGEATLYAVDWQGGPSSFVRKLVLVPGFDYTIPAGNELEVFVVVENASGRPCGSPTTRRHTRP